MLAKTSNKGWWVILLQSVIAFCFGTLLLLFPRGAARSFVFIISLYLILDGGSTLISKTQQESKISIGLGALAMVIGIVTLLNPSWLGIRLILLLGGWTLIRSIMNFKDGLFSRTNKRLAIGLGLSGLPLMAFAFWIFSHTESGAFLFMRWMGIFGIIYGYILLGLSYELKRDIEIPGAKDERKADSNRAA